MAALRETLDQGVLMFDGSSLFSDLLLGSSNEGAISAATSF